MISERSIARTCRPAVLGRGRIIAEHAGRIRERTCAYDGTLTKLSARVASSTGGGSYRAEVAIDEVADTVVRHQCTCPAATRFPGPCKHAVALMLDFNRNADAYAGWNELEHVSTSSVVSDYLDRIATAPRHATTADAPAGSVRLAPTIVHDGDVFVRLRVGTGDGGYVVKSIGELAGRIADGTWHSYGKRLAFVHTLDAFDPWSRELAAFVCRCAQNRRAYAAERLFGHVYAVSGTGGNIGRELHLSGPETDELIELCMGHEVDFEHAEATGAMARGRVRVTDGDPNVALAVEPLGDGSFELVRNGTMDFFTTATHAYAAQGGTLLRCTPAFGAAAGFFASVYASATPNLLLAEADAARFAATALPTLEAAMPVAVPDELERLRPIACRLEFRLDSDGDAVTCRADATYGDVRVNVLVRGAGDGAVLGRDLAAEAAARTLVCRYFATVEAGVARLPVRGADDALATLLFEGVDRMRALGAVTTTASFARLASVRRPRVSVGLTMRGGLIDLAVSAEDLPADELHALLTRYRRRKRYYRLRDGSFVDLAALDLDRASLIADELGLTAAELAAGHATVPAYKAFLLDALLKDEEHDDAFTRYVEGFRAVDPTRYEVPASLASRLRPYQVDGFRWLSALSDMGFGGILADEMGLGKSVQLIALLLARHDALAAGGGNAAGGGEDGGHAGGGDARRPADATTLGAAATTATDRHPSLIVCPASLVYNWKAEFEKFAPEMDVAVVAGTANERAQVRDEVGHEVLVTSYDLARRDVEAYAAMDFWCLALDEAQYIKNHETLVARAVKTIGATHRFALTGTPIENRLAELWSIFDFLMPGLLGGHDRFRERYEQALADDDGAAATRLAAAVGPFIMRRRKQDVLADLPDKLEQVVSTKMDATQRSLYVAHEQALRLSLTGQADADFRGGKLQVLAELMRLRQLCCDPRLVFEDYDGGSCKLDAIVELVGSAMASQQKVLVFSQFTRYLALIASALEDRDVAYYTIVGSTPKRRRVELANAFNADDTPVFLVSLKAGGTGLNLTGASVVIHADPWWNAAAQQQATDRAHRIGQTRDVTVYKVIAAHSIEERILALQDAKATLAEQVVGGATGSTGLAGLTRADLIDLLADD